MAITPSTVIDLTPAARQERDSQDQRVQELMHQLVRAVERGYRPRAVRQILDELGQKLGFQLFLRRGRRLVVCNGGTVIEDVPLGKHMTDQQIDALARALILSAEN